MSVRLVPRRGVVLVGAVVGPAVICAGLATVRTSVDNTSAGLILVLVIVGAASSGYRTAGMLAAASSAVWFDFFLTAPYHRLTIVDRADVETAVLLLVVGAAVTELALWGRRQQARASRQSGYLEGVLSASAEAGRSGASAATIIGLAERHLVGVLGIDRARFTEHLAERLPTLRPDGTVVTAGRDLDVDRSGLPTDTELRLPVRNGGRVCGEFRLVAASRVARPTLDQRRIAVLLADQVGSALVAGHR